MARKTTQFETEDKERMAIQKIKEFYKKLQNNSKQALVAAPPNQKKNLIVKLPRVPAIFRIHSSSTDIDRENVHKKKIKATKHPCSSHPRDFLILKSEKSFTPGKVRIWSLKEHLIGCRSLSKADKREELRISDHKIKSIAHSKSSEIPDYSIERKEERQFQISRI